MRQFGLTKYRDRQRKLRENGLSGETRACRQIMKKVVPGVGEELEREFTFFSDSKNNPPAFLMYVFDFDPWELGFIATKALFDCMDEMPKLQQVGVKIGKAIENVARRRYFEENRGRWDEYLLSKKQKPFKGHRQTAMELFFEEEEKHEKYNDYIRFRAWRPHLKVTLGLWLFEKIRMFTGLFEIFYVSTPNSSHHSVKHVRPTSQFCDWIQRYDKWKELMCPTYLATNDKPLDWIDSKIGGYDHDGDLPTSFVKYRDDASGMEKLYASVNAIQSVKWQINPEVLEVATKSWEQGLCLGGMPVNEEHKVEKWYDGDTEGVAFSEWKANKRRALEHNLRMRGKRMRTGKTIYIANWYARNLKDGFYFPHNIDYRGRVYPLPALVNPQGDDLGRNMLMFAKGEQIVDEEDFKWVCVHGANMYGKKGTYDERVRWIKSREECILASAGDPFAEQWWCDASDPWGMLAFCFEYAKWKREGYGYTSYLPVHQDASNNGIQMMSLLLRDEKIGRKVNLVPDAPMGDMYEEIIENVRKELRARRSKCAYAAAWFKFGVSRKYSKPIVMAKPYGAEGYTNVDVLTPIYEEEVENSYRPFTKGENLRAIRYLTQMIQEEVDKLLPDHMALMKWIRSLYTGGEMVWTAPHGYKVRSVNWSYKKVHFQTVVNGLLDKCYVLEPDTVDVKRIRRALVANYIHSLDASVVHRVAEQMEFDIGFVHDSFCCHAPNVKKLKRTLLQTYKEFFSRNLLEELSLEVSKNQKTESKSTPQFGSLDVSQITRCQYVFH